MAQLQDGNHDAFEEIYQRCHGYLSFVCTKFTDNKEDIEEVVQDAFHIAFKNIQQVQGQAIIPYLRKVAVHECFRKRKANSRYANYATPTGDITIDYPELDEALLPEEALQNKERQLQLLKEIDRLPKLQREMVYLYYYVDIDAKEIADLMHCTVGSVYSVLTRARKTLKQKLDDDRCRAGILVAKSLAVLPLAALFLAEETTYVAAYTPASTAIIATGAAATTTATATTTGTIISYAAACIVAIGLVTGTYLIAFQNAYFYALPPVYDTTTTTALERAPEPIAHTPYEPEAMPAPTTLPPTTPEPTTPVPTTPEPTTPEPTTPPLSMPVTTTTTPASTPPTQPPTAPAPIIPINRTADILLALSQAATPDDVAHIIATYDFAFETQIITFTDYILRFYIRNEGSGDILIGTSIHASASSWRIQYIFFDGGSVPFDGTGLYRWMRN